MVTKEILKQGIDKGIVKFVPNPNLDTGMVCQIGEYWFYFGGMTAELEMQDDFLKNSDKKEIVNSIYLLKQSATPEQRLRRG